MSRGCPEREGLERAHDGGGLAADLRTHLADCRTCAETWRELAEQERLLGRMRTLGVEPQGDDVPAAAGDVPGYEIVREVRRGGQGVVYEAVQAVTRRRVAIKMLLHSNGGSRERQRFEREIELAANMHHPNVVTVHAGGTLDDGRLYSVMEMIEGEPVDLHWRRRRERGPVAIDAILDQFLRICGAVSHAHECNIIHRDLKPGNILIDEQGEPHVLDFGVAKALGREPGIDAAGLTRTGEFLGSLAYAAPEQVEGDPAEVDVRADVHGLGLILYELLTGVLPYPVTGSLAELVRVITKTNPAPPSRHARGLCGRIGPDLDAILLRALARLPAERYPTVAALMDDLRRCLAGLPVLARRPGAMPALRSFCRAHRPVVSAAALLVVVAAVLLSWVRDRRSERLAHGWTAEIAAGARRVAEGAVAAGEALLWTAHLAAHAEPGRLAGQPLAGPLASHFALWQLYRQHPCLWTVAAHPAADGPRSVRWSPGGDLLVTLDGRTLKSWDPDTGASRASFPVPDLRALAFADDGALLVLGSFDGRVLVMDPVRGTLLREWQAHDSAVSGIDVQGERVATMASAGDAALWQLQDGTRLQALPALAARGFSVAFDLDGTAVALGHQTATTHIDLETGVRQTLPNGSLMLLFEPLGRYLLQTLGSGFRLLDADTLDIVDVPLPGFAGHVVATATRDPERLVATGAVANGLRVWDALGSTGVRVLHGHAARVVAIDAAPGGRCASLDATGILKTWDLVARRDLTVLRSAPRHDTAHALALDAAGRRLAMADGLDGCVCLRDPRTGARIGRLAHDAPVYGVDFHPTEPDLLASAGGDGIVRLWDVAAGAVQASFPAHGARLGCLAFSPAGDRIAVAGEDRTIAVLDVRSGRRLQRLAGHTERIPFLAWSPSGTRLASASRDGTIALWDVASGRLTRRLADRRAVMRGLAFSPDGRLLAAVGEDPTHRVVLWDVASGRVEARLTGYLAPVWACAFSPDGALLASGDTLGQIHLWDVAARRDLVTVANHGREVYALRFAPSGTALISSSADGTVVRWDLTAYDRHLAANLLHRLGPRVTGTADPHADARQWAEQVLHDLAAGER